MDKNKTKSSSPGLSNFFEVSDRDLENTLENYLDEPRQAPAKPSFLNAITLSGLAILMTGFVAVMQVFIPFEFDFDGIFTALPIFGGILVLLLGLGFFNSEYRARKKQDKKSKSQKNNRMNQAQSQGSGASNIDPVAMRQKKKLFKSRTDKRISGICGGLAQYFGVDATLVRIAFVALFFLGSGTPVFLYIAMSLLLEKEPKSLNP